MNKINQILKNDKLCGGFEKLSKVGKGIIAVLVFACFLYLSVWSMLGTTTFNNYEKGYEFFYDYDNIVINIVCMVLILVLMYTIFNNFLGKVDPKILSVILSVYVIVMGTLWISSTKSLPTTDAENLVDTAVAFLDKDYKWFDINEQDYYYLYPFQLGFVVWCQVFISMFKNSYIMALQIGNVISLVALYLGLILIVHTMFQNRRTTNYTILLFFLCFQAIMFTTLIYGNLSGLAFGVWAIYFAIKYIKTDKKLCILPCAVLLGISVLLKPNDMIIMVAICIVLALKFLDTRKIFDIVAIVICFLIGNNLINVAIFGYEKVTGADFGDGMPRITWINIGVHESNAYYENTYGWYNKIYSNKIFVSNDYDRDVTSDIAKEQILEQLEYFKENPSYMNEFFTKKLLSQWNEPTYGCIWVSERSEHSGETTEFVENVYYGKAHDIMVFIFNQYQQVVFLFACVFLFHLLKKKDVSLYVIPLVVLGGFLYHLVFEAKSQYVFTYFILLIPMASYGIDFLFSEKVTDRMKNLLHRFGTETAEQNTSNSEDAI